MLDDFAVRCVEKPLKTIFSQLHGQKLLLAGNREEGAVLKLGWAGPPKQIMTLSDAGVRVVACRFAVRVRAIDAQGRDPRFGHSHNRIPADNKSCEVGVDACNLMPCVDRADPGALWRCRCRMPKPKWSNRNRTTSMEG